MTRTIEITHVYDAPLSAVWDSLRSWPDLAESMRGRMTYEGLSSGMMTPGEEFTVRLVAGDGTVVAEEWRIAIDALDEDARTIDSREGGGPVRQWDHHMKLEALPDGRTRYTDVVAIDAGEMTDALCEQSVGMYDARHHARERLIRERLANT